MDKGKKLISLDDMDTSVDDELSLGSFPNPSLVKSKNNKDRTRWRHSHRPAFNDSNGGMLRRVTSRGKNPPSQALNNTFVLPTGPIPVQPAYLTFETRPALYITLIATIRDPNDKLSSPWGSISLNTSYQEGSACRPLLCLTAPATNSCHSRLS